MMALGWLIAGVNLLWGVGMIAYGGTEAGLHGLANLVTGAVVLWAMHH